MEMETKSPLSSVNNDNGLRVGSVDASLDLLKKEEELENAQLKIQSNIDNYLEQKVYNDRSPEAKAGRRRAMYRAAYGEFMCTFIFFFTVFSVIVNAKMNGWDGKALTVVSAFNAGLQAVAMCFAFSSVSGAHFNPAVSFALWLTKKLSNRKIVVYIFVQLLASICAMGATKAIFIQDSQTVYEACVITPPDDDHLGRVFATEFILTWVLTYVAFTIAFEDAESQKKDTMSLKGIAHTRGLTVYASTPQSKAGFAPFVIGFTIFSLALIGGESGGAFNPARMFGPALLTGNWKHSYVYFFGQMAGGATAGLMVHNLHRLGLDHKSQTKKVDTPILPTLPLVKDVSGKPIEPMVISEV